VAGNAGNVVEELRAAAVSVVFADVVFEDDITLLASNDDDVVVGSLDGIVIVVVIVGELDDVNTVLSMIDDDVEIGMGVCIVIVGGVGVGDAVIVVVVVGDAIVVVVVVFVVVVGFGVVIAGVIGRGVAGHVSCTHWQYVFKVVQSCSSVNGLSIVSLSTSTHQAVCVPLRLDDAGGVGKVALRVCMEH
jgi:hypothetical protein